MKRDPPPTYEETVLKLSRKRKLLRTSDIAALGVPTVVLTRLVRSGKLLKAGRGLFTLPDHQPSAQCSLQLKTAYRDGITHIVLMRIGNGNAARIKAKLREIRSELTRSGLRTTPE